MPENFDLAKELWEARKENMTILVGTYAILEVLLKREPHRVMIQAIITKCVEGGMSLGTWLPIAYLICSILVVGK